MYHECTIVFTSTDVLIALLVIQEYPIIIYFAEIEPAFLHSKGDNMNALKLKR